MAAGRRPVRQRGMYLVVVHGSASSVPDNQSFISSVYAVFRTFSDNYMNLPEMATNGRSMRSNAHGNLAADGKVCVIDSAAIKPAAAAACDVGCCSCSMPSPLPARIGNTICRGAASARRFQIPSGN
jgi:hypothetical protein